MDIVEDVVVLVVDELEEAPTGGSGGPPEAWCRATLSISSEATARDGSREAPVNLHGNGGFREGLSVERNALHSYYSDRSVKTFGK